MPARKKKTLIVREPAQRRALTSAVRLELLERLGASGASSVRTLAERVGRSSHTVHYHMRLLAEAGLVERVGTRRSGARPETLYDLAADEFEVEIGPDAPGGTAHEEKALRALLRRSEREFSALAAEDPGRLSADDVFAGRLRATLSTGAKKEVLKHLRAIRRVFDEQMRADHPPHAKTETFSLTAVFLPEA